MCTLAAPEQASAERCGRRHAGAEQGTEHPEVAPRLARRWMPGLSAGYSKQSAHLARADIHESINELRFYRERMFVAS